MELTDAGAMLLPQARRILAEVQAARELMADVRGGLRGTLTIGTMQALSAGALDIPRLLAVFPNLTPCSRSTCATPATARRSSPICCAMASSTSPSCHYPTADTPESP